MYANSVRVRRTHRVRQVEIPMGHFSEQYYSKRFLFQRLIFQTVLIPEGFYSESSLFQKVNITKGRDLIFQISEKVPLGITTFRNNNLLE